MYQYWNLTVFLELYIDNYVPDSLSLYSLSSWHLRSSLCGVFIPRQLLCCSVSKIHATELCQPWQEGIVKPLYIHYSMSSIVIVHLFSVGRYNTESEMTWTVASHLQLNHNSN